MINTTTITEDQIHQLRQEAAQHGDARMVQYCLMALGIVRCGDVDRDIAWKYCQEAIESAAAIGDE